MSESQGRSWLLILVACVMAAACILSTSELLRFLSFAALIPVLYGISPVPWWIDRRMDLTTTYLHELGHGGAALVTGGRLHRILVRQDSSGLATTAGGSRPTVIAAGYLVPFGVAGLAQACILFPRVAAAATTVFGLLMVLATISAGDNHTRRIGLGFGAVLVLFSACLSPTIVAALVFLLGGAIAAHAVRSTFDLIRHPCAGTGASPLDTQSLCRFLRNTVIAWTPRKVAWLFAVAGPAVLITSWTVAFCLS